MEQNIKRTEKIVKRFRDDWVDEKGYLHTKITKEIITGPINNVQASQDVEEPLLQRIIKPLMNRPRRGFVRTEIPVKLPQPAPQPAPKPQMDFGQIMAMGKKVMDDLGIDPKELLDGMFSEKPLTNEKEVDDKKWQKTTKKQKPQKKQLKTLKKIQKTKTTKK